MTLSSWTTSGQDDAIREHAHLCDEELAVMLSEIGPARTEAAIAFRRQLLKLRRPEISRRSGCMVRAAAQLRMTGWPVMVGTDEERDRAFVYALRSFPNWQLLGYSGPLSERTEAWALNPTIPVNRRAG